MGAFLEIERLSKSFGKLMALSDVSFEVEKGELVGLIGPNGAGKTTLFNAMTGYYRPSSGKVVFKGEDVSRSSPDKKAKMGMVRTFQIPRPFKELTVYDNVAMGTIFNPKRVRKLGLSTSQFVDMILKGVLLYPYRDHLCELLGYGNRKLLELGRAQGPAPELLLLDEPFAGLSSTEMESIHHVLTSLASEGLTMIIVEHKLRELMRIVNRVIVLHYGTKIADGPPDEISRNEKVLKAYLGRKWGKSNA
jgi:branched-chain amino acid transport system ATP-binding protein